jgi:hypothetical protein
MSDIAILSEMINDSARVKVELDEFGKTYVTLVEPQDPSSKVTIYGLPTDAIIIKADAFDVRTVFKGLKHECKRADYVVVADTGTKKRILYIEMKKSKDLEWSVISQLKGASCFITYCKDIAKEFWSERAFLNAFEPRFISFAYTGSINKKRPKFEKSGGCHNTPEAMMKISSAHRPHFNHLAG